MPLAELSVHQVIPVTVHCTSLHLHLRNTAKAVTFSPLQKLEKLLYTIFYGAFLQHKIQVTSYRKVLNFHITFDCKILKKSSLKKKKKKIRKVKTQTSSFHYAATDKRGELGLTGVSPHLPSDQMVQTETGRFSSTGDNSANLCNLTIADKYTN